MNVNVGSKDSIHFENVSNGHRLDLERRGYKNIKQCCLDNHLIRNSPWKTYWSADHSQFGNVFIKINYGYDANINSWMGAKEAKLPAYFSAHYKGMDNIAFPLVFDHWDMGKASAVVFQNVQFEKHSLFSLIHDFQQYDLLADLLSIWNTIPPPVWWNSKYVLHDFACHDQMKSQPKVLAPFGFDLDDNIGVDPEGRLYVYDFEFIQWTNYGLQNLFIAHKLLQSRRQIFNSLSGKGMALNLIFLVKGKVETNSLKQASEAFKTKLLRDKNFGLIARIFLSYADFLIRWQCR